MNIILSDCRRSMGHVIPPGFGCFAAESWSRDQTNSSRSHDSMWLVRILHWLGVGALLPLLASSGERVAGSDLSYGDFYGNASARMLRFRDFEPRQQGGRAELPLGQDGSPQLEREARGFHFHASGEDVSVELEFIVPFLKVPVKRSMGLARDALQGILNLRTGALINTAVVVAAGAVIAAVVRLLIAPLVITSVAGGYGYKSEPDRGMRRLTDVVESQLEEHNIDASICVQRMICQYLQQNVSSGCARALNVLTSSPWLHSFMDGTAVFQAIQSARSNRSCTHTYSSCKWPSHLNWKTGGLPQVLRIFNG
ncbi:uncharacterized protein LOC108025190 [Drosophila biarmipes]|uniref:uncharacterized protein LOC108025190 n=1 Tax=Drosophila biarmipes TaxID=125945 RepID=UPI0007E70C89|nr:uncharacterized protein LOC108025190 [Drosophila biarmipes]